MQELIVISKKGPKGTKLEHKMHKYNSRLSNAIVWYQISCYLILFNYALKKISQSKNTYFYISCLENRYLCMDTNHLHLKENTYILFY